MYAEISLPDESQKRLREGSPQHYIIVDMIQKALNLSHAYNAVGHSVLIK